MEGWHYGEIYCFHLQGWRVSKGSNQQTNFIEISYITEPVPHLVQFKTTVWIKILLITDNIYNNNNNIINFSYKRQFLSYVGSSKDTSLYKTYFQQYFTPQCNILHIIMLQSLYVLYLNYWTHSENFSEYIIQHFLKVKSIKTFIIWVVQITLSVD